MHDRQRCARCGTHPDDWEVTRFAYSPEYRICPGCERLDWAREDEHSRAPGVHVELVPGETLLRERGLTTAKEGEDGG